MIKLIIIDADCTIWSHHNASSLIPPFKLLSKDLIEDRYGSKIKLNGRFREFLEFSRDNGIILSIASWNQPENVLELLSMFSIIHYFAFPTIEPHPNKSHMIQKIVSNLRKKGIRIYPEEILYIDDRDIHLKEVRDTFEYVSFIKYGSDVENWQEVIDMVKNVNV
ncbi:MAG: magnesium-dependent phosphatase-1 [Nitrososphaeria archaeon]